MSRLSVLAGQPRIALGALLTMLLAAAAVVGSGANFTATSANPANTFASGTLTIGKDNNGAILTAGNLRPGNTAAGTVDIENTGSLSGAFTLKRGTLTDSDIASPLSGKLNLTVVDCGNFGSGTPTCDAGDPQKYTGTIAGMTGDAVLGTYASHEKHRYQFTVELDGTADNAYQGNSSQVEFVWNAA